MIFNPVLMRLQWVALYQGHNFSRAVIEDTSGFEPRVRTDCKMSPAGTAELSPGRSPG
jgi:hypothetical protein